MAMVARATALPEPTEEVLNSLIERPTFGQFDPVHYQWAVRAWYAGYPADPRGLGEDYDFFHPASRGAVCALLMHVSEP
ncbi:MAG: hypothetical protein JXA87_10345 [Thermoleophilia bacterium]|nr:hypothetical protein [Thermoleophilia bacterium]